MSVSASPFTVGLVALVVACSSAPSTASTPTPEMQALLGCWLLTAPKVEGLYTQIGGVVELTNVTSRRSARIPPGLGIRFLRQERTKQFLTADWVSTGEGRGTITWGTGYEGYILNVAVAGDSLRGEARGWTDGGFSSDPVEVAGHRTECR